MTPAVIETPKAEVAVATSPLDISLERRVERIKRLRKVIARKSLHNEKRIKLQRELDSHMASLEKTKKALEQALE